MKAAIYARYSTDLQNDKSIDDQLRLCREFAGRNGHTVAPEHEYFDAAKSGASLFGRDGAFDLMAAATNGAFKAVIVEHLDRLSRDQEDLAKLYKRLSFRGVKIIQVNGGVADEIQVGINGLMSELFRKNLADKTRRGLSGKVASGQSAGGKAYGYRPVKGEPGKLEIVEEEAEVVRRIFAYYAGGMSARDIAATLNRDGIRPPRAAVWNASTVYGADSNLSGILRVPQYHGEIIWNKVRYLKDPDTGKRVPRLNPRDEWQYADVPELRIVDERTWIKVQERLGGTGRGGKGHIRKQRLLSGFIKCGVCGAGMSVSGSSEGRARISCSRNREAGACTHSRSYYLDTVEDFVIEALKAMLSKEEVSGPMLEEAIKGRRARISAQAKVRAKAEDALARAKAKRDRAIERSAMADTEEESDRWAALLPALRKEIREAEAALAKIERPSPVDLHRELIDKFKEAVGNLRVFIENSAENCAAFRAAVQEIVDCVVVHETAPNELMKIEGQGLLFSKTGETLAEVVVAGAGFEPAAFRL